MTPETKVKLIRYSVIGGVILLIVGAVVLVIHSLHGKGGGGGGDNPTPPSKTPCGRNQMGSCPDGQVCQPAQGGCITPGGGTCTTNADCNNGTCQNGDCVCDPYYLPPNCLKVCDAEHKCSNGGTCITDSGTCNCNTAIGPQGQRYTGPVCDTPITPDNCSTDNCKKPHCIIDKDGGTCKCADGWADDPSKLPERCTKCAKGRGPSGNCSKQYFNRAIDAPTYSCIDTDVHENSTNDQYCKDEFGPYALWTTKQGECPGPGLAHDDCSLSSNHILCTIPQYYASTNFSPEEWKPCGTDGGEGGGARLKNDWGYEASDPH